MTQYLGRASGKAILLGEHAVVYGEPAIAIPLTGLETRVTVRRADREPARRRSVDRDCVDHEAIDTVTDRRGLDTSLAASMLRRTREILEIPSDAAFEVSIDGELPVGAGLGSSAALAVSLLRGLGAACGQEVSGGRLAALATELEKLAHGNPSGIDPATIALERALLFRRGDAPVPLEAPQAPLVAGSIARSESTGEIVADVRRRFDADPGSIGAVIRDIGRLVLSGKEALETGDWPRLGKIMDDDHERLRELGVSSDGLESLVGVARAAGAFGAKLSGAGRGGLVLALVLADRREAVLRALELAGARRILA